MEISAPFALRRDRILWIAVSIAILGGLTWSMAVFLPPAVDWNSAFRPAALLLLQGKSPYSIEGFFNAPWTLLPLLPLALLPEAYGRALLGLFNIGAIGFTAYKFGAKPLTMGLLLISPPLLHGVLNGNIDGLSILGFVLPPHLGLFLLMIKPQIGIAGILFWLIQSWTTGGLVKVLRVFGPITIAMLISFAIFGFWPIFSLREVDLWWNASLWPMSIPVGLALLVAALRRRDLRFTMAASPCLVPYVLFHSWIVALVSLSSELPEMAVAVLGLWILTGLRWLSLA